ncbi:MAG: DUF262 domain-containing protein [Bacteroidales bacterium]|nr:DUF262 domain-containing protein [Bacteroidales bacterium]
MADTFYDIFNKKTILIPRLQRDYVQGGNRSLMSEFVEKLVSSVEEDRSVDLNYIYGRWESGYRYIPIDGQQRLTTLWLLFLYANSINKEPIQYSVSIDFEARESAQGFCKAILTKLRTVLSNSDRRIKLSDRLRNQSWFKASWVKDRSVKSMLSALDIIDNKIAKRQCRNDLYERLIKSSNIQFCLFSIEGQLDDDVYIKMNGRGLPLTDFEMLKSWMDGFIEEQFKPDFRSKWTERIDNEWTELIWMNRNLDEKDKNGDDISYRIDDEFMRIMYNLVYLNWICKRPSDLFESNEKEIDGLTINDNIQDLCRILNLSEKDPDAEFMYGNLMKRFHESDEYYLPLYALDKIHLFNKDQIEFIYKCFELLSTANANTEKSLLFSRQEKIINFGMDANEYKSIFHQIFLEDKPTYEKYALMYAALKPVSKSENAETSYKDWMRVMRNLICATDIRLENLRDILSTIDLIAENVKNTDIYEFLSKDNIVITNFLPNQIKEEKMKASLILKDKEWRDIFLDFENHPFCKGTIDFIFHYMPIDENYTISDFKERAIIFKSLFDAKGIRSIHKDDGRIYRALMCYSTHHTFGYGLSDSKWQFMDSKEDWKEFLIDEETNEKSDNTAHNDCMKKVIRFLLDDLKTTIDLQTYRHEVVEKVGDSLCEIYKLELENPTITDWRRFFIQYSDVWTRMGKKVCSRKSDYDILLLNKTIARDGGISELRSYCFYIDVQKEQENNYKKYKNWDEVGYEMYGETCLRIEHSAANKLKAHIDLSFRGNNNSTDDEYRLELFYRRPEELIELTDDDATSATEKDFTSIAKNINMEFKDKRYVSSCGLSKEEAKSQFDKLIESLRII